MEEIEDLVDQFKQPFRFRNGKSKEEKSSLYGALITSSKLHFL